MPKQRAFFPVIDVGRPQLWGLRFRGRRGGMGGEACERKRFKTQTRRDDPFHSKRAQTRTWDCSSRRPSTRSMPVIFLRSRRSPSSPRVRCTGLVTFKLKKIIERERPTTVTQLHEEANCHARPCPAYTPHNQVVRFFQRCALRPHEIQRLKDHIGRKRRLGWLPMRRRLAQAGAARSRRCCCCAASAILPTTGACDAVDV